MVGQWFSPGTPLIKVTAKNGINEILLKVALNTINPNPILPDSSSLDVSGQYLRLALVT